MKEQKSVYTSPYNTFSGTGSPRSPNTNRRVGEPVVLPDINIEEAATRPRTASAPNMFGYKETPSLFSELLRPAPFIMLVWIFIGSVAGGLTQALQPVFFQRAFAAHDAGLPFKDIVCKAGGGNVHCKNGLSIAGQISTYSQGAQAVVTLVLSPWTGRMADRMSRKPLLLFVSLCSLPSAITLALAIYFPDSIWLIYAYQVVSVFSGSWFLAILLGGFADACSKGNRAAAFATLLATFELAFVLGPKGGVLLSTAFRPETPYLLSLILYVVRFIPLFGFPEKKPKQDSTGEELQTEQSMLGKPAVGLNQSLLANTPSGAVIEAAKPKRGFLGRAWEDFKFSVTILNRSRFFRVLATMAFLQSGVSSGASVVMNYVLRSGFRFGANDLGNFLLIICISSLFFQLVLTKPLLTCIKERGLLFVGLVGSTISPLCTGIVVHLVENKKISFGTSRMFVFIIAGSLSSLSLFSFPAISALKANNVGDDEQGATQGALYAAKSIAAVIFPFIYAFIYKVYINSPSVIYFITSGVGFLVLVLFFFIPNKKPAKGRDARMKKEFFE